MSIEMNGKVCLITGATSGVGKVTAQELANMGAAVIGVGRDIKRSSDTCAETRDITDNTNVEYLVADLSIQAQVRDLVRAVGERHKRLDVLINNAGAFFLRRKVSSDGIEMTWALNQLNYFLLTNLLLNKVLTSEYARIVNVTSGAHYRGEIHFADINLDKGYNGWKTYCQSKLANVLFTYELARRLGSTKVTVNALTPGFVATRIGHNTGRLLKYLVQLVQRMGGITPQEGAETILYLASSPDVEGVTGKFFIENKAVKSSPISYDTEYAHMLWDISKRMTEMQSNLG